MDLKKRREFGEWIKSKRKKKGITLMELAEKMGYNSRGTIGGVEAGQMPLPVEKIFSLAENLGIQQKELLEKIRECEPELYEKYLTLEEGFEKTFFKKLRSYGRARGAEIAYHRRQNQEEIEGIGRKTILYIIRHKLSICKIWQKLETIVKNTQTMVVFKLLRSQPAR